jgi:ribosomal protein S18 acetylase RimI-like enzyme
MVTTAPGSAQATRPAGPVSSPSSSNKAVSNVSDLVIREATLQDEAELLRMMRGLAEHEPGKIQFDELAARATFRKFLSLPAFGKVWLLCEGNAGVGYIILTMGFSFEFHGHDAFIDELYVVPDHRRRGFGRQALATVEQKAREMGVNAIHLEVDRGNDAAIELYRRSGYRDHDRFLMTKWLKHD